jgi:hypothetical protein
MFDKILNILLWLFNVWKSMPDEQKEIIRKKAGEFFDPSFREFYQSEKMVSRHE